MDLIKTINEAEDVEDYSEESNNEEQYQPKKHLDKKNNLEFDENFMFEVAKTKNYSDHWNYISKFFKKKGRCKIQDKIDLIKDEKKNSGFAEVDNEDEDDGKDDQLLPEDLKWDKVETKERKKHKANQDFEFADEISENVEISSFSEMNLSRPLMKGLAAMNFVHPTPIQSAAIPTALLGRDICGCAATGTGKTAAYMLPILERLLYRPQGKDEVVTRVLILVPTRELGVQVYQVSKQLAQFTPVEFGLSIGGLDMDLQGATLRKQPDIVIATPGRLIDHIKNTPGFTLDNIEILVLDEADRMLDEYFAEQMKEIIKQCTRKRQIILFSATMTTAVEDLAAVSLTNPVKIFVDSNHSVTFNLRQEFIRIRGKRKLERETILVALITRTFQSNCIVFVKTKEEARRLRILLGLINVKTGELHGNLTQPQRLDYLKRFRDGEIDVLVATDVAARGLDIPDVRTVINYRLPFTLEHYIHRVGRTARAGRSGISISLAGETDRRLVKEIVRNSKEAVKSRVIPSDVLERYAKKVESVMVDVDRIITEQKEEKLVDETTNKIDKCKEKLEKGFEKSKPTKEWFQTRKEKQIEKDRLQKEWSAKLKKVESLKRGKNKLEDANLARKCYLEAKRKKKDLKSSTKNCKPRVTGITKKGKKSSFDQDLMKKKKKAL